MSTQRIPPHNLEAEQSLLGSILIDKESMMNIADRLHPEDFYRDAHRLIFDCMLDLFERHEPLDILAMGNRLEEKGILQKIGGRAYLVELSNMVPTSAHVAHYADIVQKKSTLRRLLGAAAEITRLGFQEEDDIEQTMDAAEHTLFNVSEKFNKNSFVPLRSVLSGAFERIDELHRERGKLRGVPTGYTELDHLLGGMQRSDLLILAARPSVGKTSLALDIARHVGVKSKIPVAVFSLEMSKEQLVDRMICAQANVDLWKLRTGRLSDRDDDFPRIGKALGDLSEAPIFIDDSGMLNIMQLRTKARRLKAEHKLGLIVIDYLQLMEGRSRSSSVENRVQEVSEISRGLKQIARELDLPILALAQLSRAVEMTKPAIPRLSHLRDSGSIEQDADVVMFIYRKSSDRNYQIDDLSPEERNIAEIHVAKHRNGPTGMVRMFFDSRRTSFLNLDRSPAPQQRGPSQTIPAPPMGPISPPPVDPHPSGEPMPADFGPPIEEIGF